MAEAEASAPKRSWLPRGRARTALELLVIVAIFLAVRAWRSADLAEGAAPALPRVGLSGPLPEHPRVVHFFAEWCSVCRAEEGNVRTLAENYPVVAIASQSGGASEVRAYLAEHDLGPAHIATDPDGTLAARYGVTAFPATFFLDDEGRIVAAEVGYTTTLGLLLRAWWAG